jgi:Zn-dependent protease
MGPAAGFLFLIQVLVINYFLRRNGIWEDEYRYYIFGILYFMNLYWGLLNLLPVLPLDGGHIFQSFCAIFGFRNSLDIAAKVGVVVGGAAAYYFFVKADNQFAGMLMLLLCFQNVSVLQAKG